MPEVTYMICEFEHKIFSESSSRFDELALETFRFQYRNNSLYRQFTDSLYTAPTQIRLVEQIPFLPISFFKSKAVVSGPGRPELVFESSGTTGSIPSRHFVQKAALYEESFTRGFTAVYGQPDQYCILALLPAYLERQHSSLVFMADHLIRASKHPQSGFYLYDFAALRKNIDALEAAGQPTLLLGVSFALLDFAAAFARPLIHTRVIETGGMKGRREELTREQLHDKLKTAFTLTHIHSEYGMTELLSQAWSHADGIFQCPHWMRVVLREEDDPLAVQSSPGKGVINCIDLANIWSCSFIATDDAGRLHADGRFEVLGRIDNSDIRGCSLMAL